MRDTPSTTAAKAPISDSQAALDAELHGFLNLVLASGGMRELRALNVTRTAYPHKAEHTESGYFEASNVAGIIQVARHFRQTDDSLGDLPKLTSVAGVYYTLNPIKAAAYGKAPSRMVNSKRGLSSSDADVAHRSLLLVDIDSPREVKGVPATDGEKALAFALRLRVRTFLDGLGWPSPIEVDSGNGVQLLYRIDLPASDEALVERVLASLGERFSGSEGDIDQSVHNAARLARLPCTMNAKAFGTDDRPHRMARVLSLPNTFEIVTTEQLQQVAELVSDSQSTVQGSRDKSRRPRERNATNGEFDEAAARWNADHAHQFPPQVSHCPICDSPDGLKASGEDSSRWACFSSRHTGLADQSNRGAGIPGRGCFTGDALDIEAWTRKCSRAEVLRNDNYLTGKPTKPIAAQARPGHGTGTKPTILMPGQQGNDRVGNDEFVAKVLQALPAGALYRRGNSVGELSGDRGRVQFEPVGEHRVRAIIDEHVQLVWRKWREQQEGYELRFKPCSRDLASVFLATAAKTSTLRDLRTIVRHPVFNTDWKLVHEGWNERDGIYYDEPSDLEGISTRCKTPLDVLHDLTIDFPFRGDADRDNALGMMLTAICSTAIKGNIPLHLVFASLERTGKGLLIDVLLGIVILGDDSVPTMQLGQTEQEREKRITSAIIAGSTLTHFDNLPTEELLESASLASLATSRVWRGRPLGHSQLITLPNTMIPIFSGNNPKASGELTKRTVPINLQPKNDRPEDRSDFVHEDVRAYAKQRRREVISALLSMVDSWVRAGRPPPPRSIRMGGFEDFIRVVGGILHHAGASCWMTNYRRWVQSGDEFTADATVLIQHWWRKRTHRDTTPSEVLEMVQGLGVFPRVSAGHQNGAAIRLSRQVLGPLTDRPVAGYILRKRSSGNASLYSLCEAKQ